MKSRQFLSRLLPAVCLTVCLFSGTAFAAGAYVASDMRLTSAEGSVTVTNTNGRRMPNISNMKLASGSRVDTEAASYANISLDAAKLLKLDEKSSAGITSDGKNLLLTLDAGSVYFNVSAPLADDESFHIKTSTMITGIRGTIGVVSVINEKHSQVTILEGSVDCEVTDPISGEQKQGKLTAGDTADFYVYEPHKEGDKTDIILHKTTADDIGGFAGAAILSDSNTAARIAAAGLDTAALTQGTEEKLSGNRQRAAEAAAEVRQDYVVVRSAGTRPGNSGSGGGSGYVSYSGVSSVTPEEAGSDPFYYEDSDDSDQGHVHSYVSSLTREPDCTTAGIVTYTCTAGDHSYEETLDAYGHDFSVTEGSHSYDPDTGKVTETYFCSRCSEMEERTYDAATYSGHVFETTNGVEICTICEYEKQKDVPNP